MKKARTKAAAPARQRRLPLQKRGERRLGEILDATEALVLELPPEAITTNHIAGRAGANVATVYHFFSNKLEIFQAICLRAILELEKTVSRALAKPSSDAEEWITRIVDAHAGFWSTHVAAVRLYEFVRTRPPLRTIGTEYMRLIYPRYVEGLRRHCPHVRPARRRVVARAIDVVVAAMLDDAIAAETKSERDARFAEAGRLLRAYVRAETP